MKSKAICITIPVELIEIMNRQHIDKSGLITELLNKYFNNDWGDAAVGMCVKCLNHGNLNEDYLCIDCFEKKNRKIGWI